MKLADAKEIQELAKILNLQNIANKTFDLNDETISNKLKDIKKSSRLKQLTFDETRITNGLKWQLSKLKEFDFALKRQHIFIVGDCLTGKTSLASTLGMNALEKGTRVIYITLDDLLAESKIKKKVWNNILKADLVIIDDVFYIAPTEEELILIYKIVMFLQETRSIIIVTNRPLSSWKEMKVDSHLMETLQKRSIQNAQIISLA